jgi:peptide/nickel transport system permease protein
MTFQTAPEAVALAGADEAPSLLRRTAAGARGLPWVPIVILAVIILSAIFAPLLTQYGFEDADLRHALQAPSGDHWLGTDTLGRDSLTRLLFGARISLLVVISAALGSGLVGLAVGIVSGAFGGVVDAILMRVTDAFMGLPTILITLVFVTAVGQGLRTVIVALSIVGWSPFARIIRSEVLSLKERQFVSLARIAGARRSRIMLVHILPNVFNTFMVISALQMSNFVLGEASLSFLGAGVPPPTPTWGNMISDGLPYMTTAWWLSVVPGVALVALVFAMNMLSDWMRDALDPRLRQA